MTDVPKMTKAQDSAIADVLRRAGEYQAPQDLIEDVYQAALVGDEGLRWAVVTRDPHGNEFVFGPFATAATAKKAIDSGILASVEGTRGRLVVLMNPRTSKTRGKTDPALPAWAASTKPDGDSR